MTDKTVRLSDLPVGYMGTVCNLPEDIVLKNKLISFGIINGTEIYSAFRSFGGSTTAYLFRGTLLSIRKSYADRIIIQFG